MKPAFSGRLFAAVLALLCCYAVRAQAGSRAVWVWEAETYDMLEHRSAARAAVRFCGEKGLDALYLYADSYKGRNLLLDKPKLYRKLIRRLHKKGIKAYALLGSWHLHTEEYVLPERREEALAMYRRVLEYNAKTEPRDRFDGVNLDIEPHLLGAWKTDRERLLLAFLDLGRALMAAKKNSPAAPPTGPAVPFWLDQIELEWEGARKPASEHVLDVYDYAAVMAYRDAAEGRDGMVAHAASELKYAGSIGKQLVVGVEVTPNEIKKVSFDHLGEADLERELSKAFGVFAAEPAFGGFVIHHYESYRAWLKRQADGGKEK